MMTDPESWEADGGRRACLTEPEGALAAHAFAREAEVCGPGTAAERVGGGTGRLMARFCCKHTQRYVSRHNVHALFC